MNQDDQNAIDLVRRGYDEPTRVLTFRVSFWETAAALDALRAIGQYNGFDGGRVAAALEESLPTDALCLRLYVGRESSPVLYIRGLTDEQADRVKLALYSVRVDELDRDGDGNLRAWWD